MIGDTVPLNNTTIILQSNKKFLNGKKFKTALYQQRIMISAETFLLEANERGKLKNTDVHVVIVGLGLGHWQAYDTQVYEYLYAFQTTIQKLYQQKSIPFIKHVEFSWIPETSGLLLSDGQTIPNTDIIVSFTNDDPFQKKNEKFLKVAMYAWDGNAFPGNEYWSGVLNGSGDSAAACCSQIPQLQNAYINMPNICGKNIHIASSDFGVLHISDFAKKKLSSLNS